MSLLIAIRDLHTDSPKARVCRPKAKWSSCTMGPGWAAARAAAKELGCAEEEIELTPIRSIKAYLYTASRKQGGSS